MASNSSHVEQQTATPAIIPRGGKAVKDELRQRLIDVHQTGVGCQEGCRLPNV